MKSESKSTVGAKKWPSLPDFIWNSTHFRRWTLTRGGVTLNIGCVRLSATGFGIGFGSGYRGVVLDFRSFVERYRKPGERKSRMLFLRQFLAKPVEVASVIPSSAKLVEALLSDFPHQSIRLAVEYGPGTGAITSQLLALLPPSAIYLGSEPNSVFRQHLSQVYPDLILIPDYAQNISSLVLGTYGQADFIASGLPCSVIPMEELERLFVSTHEILREGGEFRMFIYLHTLVLPKMHRMLRTLNQIFKEVSTATVWLNMPPALIIRCVK
jgi:phosphatidylethanolamine/phosphatidyl-N-methylethanolamine N-methyltransferase